MGSPDLHHPAKVSDETDSEEEKSNYKRLKGIVMGVGEIYKNSLYRIHIRENSVDSLDWNTSGQDYETVFQVEQMVLRCRPEHRYIIYKDFLTDSEPDWYLDEYSRSAYYRLKHKAVLEFIHCLSL